jgi:PAS domain S-box-containing protein
MKERHRGKPGETASADQRLHEWETLFNTIGSAIWILDTQHVIRRSNRAAAELLGRPVETMIGRHCWEIVHGSSQAIPQCPLVCATQSKKRESLELPIGEKWFEIVVDVILDASGRPRGYIHIINDITERKLLEEHLRESEERYRNLFDNSQATMLVIDPANGRIVDANLAACKYYGYSLEQLKAKAITQINTLTSEEVFEEMARSKAEQRNHFYFYHRLANGEVRPVEVYSGPVHQGKHLLYSIVHDIGERVKVEQEKERLIGELRDALSKIKTLSGLLPICASCKKIRDDKGYWRHLEVYLRAHTQADFSHSICPDCAKKLYPEYKYPG